METPISLDDNDLSTLKWVTYNRRLEAGDGSVQVIVKVGMISNKTSMTVVLNA